MKKQSVLRIVMSIFFLVACFNNVFGAPKKKKFDEKALREKVKFVNIEEQLCELQGSSGTRSYIIGNIKFLSGLEEEDIVAIIGWAQKNKGYIFPATREITPMVSYSDNGYTKFNWKGLITVNAISDFFEMEPYYKVNGKKISCSDDYASKTDYTGNGWVGDLGSGRASPAINSLRLATIQEILLINSLGYTESVYLVCDLDTPYCIKYMW